MKDQDENQKMAFENDSNANKKLIKNARQGFAAFKQSLNTVNVLSNNFIRGLDSLIDYVKDSDESSKKIVNTMIDGIQAELQKADITESRSDELYQKLFKLFELVAKENEKNRGFIGRMVAGIGFVLLAIPSAIIFNRNRQ